MFMNLKGLILNEPLIFFAIFFFFLFFYSSANSNSRYSYFKNLISIWLLFSIKNFVFISEILIKLTAAVYFFSLNVML